MKYRKWDEWDSEHEQFIVLSYYGQPDFVFSIGKLPNFRFDEANSIHEVFLRRLREAYRKHLKKDGYDGYSHDIKLVWKMGLTDKEIESLLNDHRPVKQWLKSVAIQVKESLEAIVKFKVERLTELDDSDSIDPVPANVERPDSIASFPVDSYSPVVPEGLIPVPAVASRKDFNMVTSSDEEVRSAPPASLDDIIVVMKNMEKGQRQGRKQQIEIQQKSLEVQQKSLELQQQAALKNAELTATPKPEQSKEGSTEKPKPEEIPHDDKYYLSIKDHYERPQAMFKDKYTWKEISAWERKHEDILNDDPLNPLPSTNWDAIRKRKPKSKK